jgi:hypothetical protein
MDERRQCRIITFFFFFFFFPLPLSLKCCKPLGSSVVNYDRFKLQKQRKRLVNLLSTFRETHNFNLYFISTELEGDSFKELPLIRIGHHQNVYQKLYPVLIVMYCVQPGKYETLLLL